MRRTSLLRVLMILTITAALGGGCRPADRRPAADTESAPGSSALPPGSSVAAPPPFDAEAHVAAWVELWGTYDLARVDDLFLAGPDTTYFSSERQDLIVGLDAIREHHAGFGFVPGGIEPEQELWVEDVHTGVFGPTAVVNAIWYFGERGATGTEGATANQRGPMTVVYVLDGDTYKIAHMHFASYEDES